ncbi:MAG TPA: Ig domain-containing protein, partial [Blastocatellia bacterium]
QYSLSISFICPTVTVSPANATLPVGTIGALYSQTYTQTGGTGTIIWSNPSGGLPGGLILNASTGEMSGSPTTVGNFTFTIRATDVNSCSGERQYSLTVRGNGLMFYPLPAPVRLLETRSNPPNLTGCNKPNMPIAQGGTFTLPAKIPCAGIPANAAAVTGNITVVPSGAGYLTLFPSDATQPTVANSNFATGEITNNVFTVGLGAGDGAFKIFSSATTEVIIDVTGYYAPPGAGGLYFHPLSSPVRLLETRPGQNGCIVLSTQLNPNADPNLDLSVQGRFPLPSPCNSIPASAQVLVGNATSVLPSGGGHLTIYPSGGTRPTVASSNYAGSDVINGPFAVKLGADGNFKIYTFATTDLVVDILGYYSEDVVDSNGPGLLFNPLPSPVRLLETRPDFPGFPLSGCTRTNAKIQGNLVTATHTQQAAGFCNLPAEAQAVVGNVSVVNSAGAGFLTLFPGNLLNAPLVATSNYPAPATFGYNRHYFVGLSPTDGTFKILTQFTTDLILDASGYFAP